MGSFFQDMNIVFVLKCFSLPRASVIKCQFTKSKISVLTPPLSVLIKNCIWSFIDCVSINSSWYILFSYNGNIQVLRNQKKTHLKYRLFEEISYFWDLYHIKILETQIWIYFEVTILNNELFLIQQRYSLWNLNKQYWLWSYLGMVMLVKRS